ncbi:protocatechuate 4,5-dioxygenase subunit alpha [Vibrio sp. F74]|uniref:protocatechuate 4,5-dioxygenase subunit alpha n=1 Tax=Vibrio sp. F74 TaxID=700020 RepID=UPI0035F5CF03
MKEKRTSYLNTDKVIPGTIMFDGTMARKGYGLNKMCYSFNNAPDREAFLADETAYCDRFNLSPAQKEAIKNRDVLKLLEEGGSIYYLAKFVGILGLNMQDIGAIQTGMSLEEFNELLRSAGD